jgi:phosphoribosylformylglycinamidine cyclo-ligase
MTFKRSSYFDAGVDTDKEVTAVKGMGTWLKQSFCLSEHKPLLDMDFFANVIDLDGNTGLALSTDGVGSKVLIAQMMGRYDTIGIDCVAMNVNDVLCVGAKPIAMLDYLGIQQQPDLEISEQIAKGLLRGAEMARISIPGGETAQLPDIIRGVPGRCGMDLVGMCVGLVPLDSMITGQSLRPGDVVIGLRSSGVHSNGLTLARKVLLEDSKLDIDRYLPDLGRTLGEELLEPTRIYARSVLAVLRCGIQVTALVNITSDGLLNLTRVYNPDVGYKIEHLPPSQPIFELIRTHGDVPIEEMYRVYNMGVGFCIVVRESDAARAVSILEAHDEMASIIGSVTADSRKRVVVEPAGLVGEQGKFHRA